MPSFKSVPSFDSNAAADDFALEQNQGQKLMVHERHSHILKMLRVAGSVQVASLAHEIGVSEMTVRRDLVELERAGRLTRIHGGALAVGGAPVAMDQEEPSFDARLLKERRAKEAIAAKAAELVKGYRTLALDVGTTTFCLARRLTELTHATIFTNSLRIADLMGDGAPEVYVAGGRIRPDERAIGGPTAIAQFEQLWFDAAVVGVSGVTVDGLFDYSFDDADMKRVYLRRSGVKIVLCDATKFQRMSLVHLCDLSGAGAIVTDAEPPAEIRAALKSAKVELHIAPAIA